MGYINYIIYSEMKRMMIILCYMLLIVGVSYGQKANKAKELPKHLILIGFDGLSAKSIRDGANMPTLRKLMSEGSSTLEGRTILPSSSACNWASMFMGAGTELHGYTTWGSQKPELPSRVVNSDNRFPNIFGLYRDNTPNAEIGYIFEWEGMNYLVDTLAINYRLYTTDCTVPAIKYIKEKKPNLCAVIYHEPDGVGHSKGWSSPEYMNKLTELDKSLSEIVKAVEESGIMNETVIIVTSDHGGIKTGHGGVTMEEMQRPVVFYGKNIRKGFTIEESNVVYDIGGTMAYLLGVKQPQVWTARPIMSIFNK